MKHSKFDFINDTKFKQFLRKELDKNENRNDQDLGKFEVWFEFVKTCEQIIEHNETDLKTISELMIKMNNNKMNEVFEEASTWIQHSFGEPEK